MKEIIEMGKKSKHSYRYDLVKRGGNSVVMKSNKALQQGFISITQDMHLWRDN